MENKLEIKVGQEMIIVDKFIPFGFDNEYFAIRGEKLYYHCPNNSQKSTRVDKLDEMPDTETANVVEMKRQDGLSDCSTLSDNNNIVIHSADNNYKLLDAKYNSTIRKKLIDFAEGRMR